MYVTFTAGRGVCQPGGPVKNGAKSRCYVDFSLTSASLSQYHARLMSGRLPDYVDFLRLARQGQRLRGELSQSRMPRLATSLRGDTGVARVDLDFGLDARRQPMLRARIETELVMECQRCLAHYTLPVRVETVFGLIEHESQAERLPEGYEPLLVGDEPMSPLELVEDELILALPVVARHEHDDPDCRPQPMRAPDETVAQDRGRPNPFAVLSRLKE